MIASLGMYDLPWLRRANDTLWAVMADHLRAMGVTSVPDRLTRDRGLDDIWRAPDLLLAQSCGYPVMEYLREAVQIVATPRYRAEGCTGTDYRAAIIVQADSPATRLEDLRGSRAGVNDLHSNSGMNLFRAAIAPIAEGRAFFGSVTLTGAHARSFAGVASGRLDVAAVDAVTLAHLRRRYPRRAAHVRVLAWTPSTAGLPLVTAARTTPATLAALRAALDATLSDVRAAHTCETLMIEGFQQLDRHAYQPVLALQAAAIAHGYDTLR